MKQDPAPIRLAAVEESGETGGSRIHRILGYPSRGEQVASLVTRWEPGWQARYVDASRETPVSWSNGTVAIHVLWTDGRQSHVLHAGVDDPWEVVPGDTITIPPGMLYRIGAGIIAFCIETDDATLPAEVVLVPPTHGLSVFHRYNRRTICSATPGLVLERWKLTHPLDLPLGPDRWHYLTNLVTPVALSWPGGSELVERGGSRLLPAGLSGITLVPDGLGYVLLAYVPDLERDVIAPLWSAGYDADTIAALGVPRAMLDAPPGP